MNQHESDHIVRGGSWHNLGAIACVTSHSYANGYFNHLGVRLIRLVSQLQQLAEVAHEQNKSEVKHEWLGSPW